jgi:uncharacterized protein (DUF1015 family)
MAEIEPLRAVHYNVQKTGGLQAVVAPPYDVIDPRQRRDLAARSPYNVVNVDLPQGDDPYASAAELFSAWKADDVLVRDTQPALWILSQKYTGPDGRERIRTGFFARVRVEEYGPGRIRPHERTHPGPKEDRLRLTRATRANLSPIFSLFDDSSGEGRAALEPAMRQAPWGEATDDDGTINRLWRIEDPAAIANVQRALEPTELLIADGHHRYETARVYADEIGGGGPHRYVLMCLVALQDPGLTVFPTHRLVKGLGSARQEELADAIRRDFEIEPLPAADALVPKPDTDVSMGYIDGHFRKPFILTLKDQAIADAALEGHSDPYRHLDTAVLEALILKGTLGMSDQDIDHLKGLGYARDLREALKLIYNSEYEAGFFMAPIPVERIQAVAATGESMPPKSTYFFPKVPTGLLFNPLD